MTCIKKRLRIAYENIAFYGNKTWINDCFHYTRMNQELYARECKIQESEWTELVVRRPRTVQDVIPNSKLALYHNSCEYNASRELSYRPTLSFDITFHYPCLHRHSAYNEPWMLPEVEELFMMHTCVDTFNFLWYKRLEELPNLDFIDARHSDDFCCQLEIEEDFHEITPLLEDMFDRTPGQPCTFGMGNENNERADVVIPPLYKVTTLDEMLMKMKLRFGNIRQIWSVSKGGTCPDRAMKVFKSPFKSSFVREKHHFDIRGIEMFTIFPHGRDARRLRNLREIRSIQKLAEAIKDFKKSLKQIKHQQATITYQQQNRNSANNNQSQGTSAPSLASEETATSSTTPTTRRLYSDVVQGLSNINKTPPLIRSENSSTEGTQTPSTSSARESYISISSSSSLSPQSNSNATATTTRSATPPLNWVIPEVSGPLVVEEMQINNQPGGSNTSQHSIVSSSYRTQASSMSTCSDVSSINNQTSYSINSLQRTNSRPVENPLNSFQNPPQHCANTRPQQQPTVLPHHQQVSTCYFSNSFATPSTSHNNTIGFYSTPGGFYHHNSTTTPNFNNFNYSNQPQQIPFRNNQQAPAATMPIHQQQPPQVQTRTYQNQTAIPSSNTWVFASHPQFTQQNALRTNSVYTVSNLPHPYLVMPQGGVVKTNSTVGNQRWPPGNQQQYNQRPITIPPTITTQNIQQQPQQIYHSQNSHQPQAVWQHVNQVPGTMYRTTQSPQQQIVIEEPRPRGHNHKPSAPSLPRVNSNTTILSRPSCSNSKTQPTSILMKSNNLDQQRRLPSRPPEDGTAFRGGIIITSRSDDLERQALEEYHPSSNDMLLTEIERQAEEQYENSSENCLSPPSNDFEFVIEFQSRGAAGIMSCILILYIMFK